MHIPQRLRSAAPWYWLAAVWFTLLFILSSREHVGPVFGFPHQDKVLHATYYTAGSLCLFFATWYRQRGASLFLASLAGILFCASVGAFDEWHQTFTPGRSGNDPWDWLADLTGGLLGAWIGRLLCRQQRA
jgi:VanZ family protein